MQVKISKILKVEIINKWSKLLPQNHSRNLLFYLLFGRKLWNIFGSIISPHFPVCGRKKAQKTKIYFSGFQKTSKFVLKLQKNQIKKNDTIFRHFEIQIVKIINRFFPIIESRKCNFFLCRKIKICISDSSSGFLRF